ncbi:hypothetical protein AKJ52_01855 [candidate division MSBL1 archaeon SCGC-AAA382C18]|uniref:Uncharacterized protein n=1 Tax=candidate division MSBL1 archaeon SCGC-AAA382C18 TaxID=1698281 RepID=A0A133VJP0_9EURY|nr:hypothetical protein AKJ52_01855 [candidate division MSBL1 archaeon SCGC-AAA382C18]
MPSWKTHRKWAERFLQWGNKTYPSEDITDLIDFPKKKEFLLPHHDFNRRTWRDGENRAIIYNVFGKTGIQTMDLHYCLDFLKEETSLEIIKQKWMMYPGIRHTPEFYPSTTDLATWLAGKARNLDLDMEVFKFVIVNFREILTDIISEHDYSPEKLRNWQSESFNRIVEELEKID